MARKARETAKILVIKLGALGDFVQALAAMKHIREAHPAAHITLLTTPPFEALARASPYFNDVESDGRPDGLAKHVLLAIASQISDRKAQPQSVGGTLRAQQIQLRMAQLCVHLDDRDAIVRVIPRIHLQLLVGGPYGAYCEEQG